MLYLNPMSARKIVSTIRSCYVFHPGAADGALRSIHSSERDLGSVTAQQAARILGLMANIFQVQIQPFIVY